MGPGFEVGVMPDATQEVAQTDHDLELPGFEPRFLLQRRQRFATRDHATVPSATRVVAR